MNSIDTMEKFNNWLVLKIKRAYFEVGLDIKDEFAEYSAHLLCKHSEDKADILREYLKERSLDFENKNKEVQNGEESRV